MNIRILVFFYSLFFVLFSCDSFKIKEDSESLMIHRFDLDLMKFDTSHFENSEKEMMSKYGDLYPFYIEQLMGLGSLDKNSPYYYQNHLKQFLSGEYPAMMDSISQKDIVKNISKYESELDEVYDNMKKEFPEKKRSVIYSFFISPMGANPQAAFSYGNDTIGLNWFHYLGKDFTLYTPFYEGYSYMIEWSQPQYLSRNIALVEYNLLKEKYNTSEPSELLYNMIDKGKQYYFLDKICPKMKDETKIGYTEEQLKWCNENEYEIWAYLKENKLLYSKDMMDVKRLTEEGPTTSGMPSQSPGMVGTWVGWQIVKSYMEKENKSLKELLLTSSQDIMKGSRYKPKN